MIDPRDENEEAVRQVWAAMDDYDVELVFPTQESIKAWSANGMGPSCPHCGASLEWTISEIWEDVYADKTFTCNNRDCFQLFVLSLEEILAAQETCRASLMGSESWQEDDYSTKSEDVEWNPPPNEENEEDNP